MQSGPDVTNNKNITARAVENGLFDLDAELWRSTTSLTHYSRCCVSSNK